MDDSMRNKIFGIIGVVWGGAVVLQVFVKGVPTGGSAYGIGSIVGLMFGVALLVAGAWALTKQRRAERRFANPS
jgi:hypothetical protein